jgi:two-component system, OmpR family, sensor kinase
MRSIPRELPLWIGKRSIRRELLLWLLLGLVVAVSAAATSTYYLARREAKELFDYQLKQLALSVANEGLSVPPRANDDEHDEDLAILVWDENLKLLHSSRPGVEIPSQLEPGYTNVATHRGHWRVFSVRAHGRLVQVAQRLSVYEELAAAMAFRVVAPLLVILPLLGALVWLTVRRGLRPLTSVTSAVRARTPAALQPLPESDLPEEVQPLVHALNDLLARLGRAMAAQRGFIADAAHELRTPLTAVQLQLELARWATNPEEREAAFEDLQRGVSRAIHLVSQLLTLARQEPEVREGRLQPTDLAEIARLVVAEQTPLAVVRQVDVGISDAVESVIQGDPEALRVMLGNLVDNAIRYSPTGGRVDVAVAHGKGQALLAIQDSGPGIPIADRERVFDRFFRGHESDAPGSGLGLAIVKSIADRHHATIGLDSGPGGRGLLVSISFSM